MKVNDYIPRVPARWLASATLAIAGTSSAFAAHQTDAVNPVYVGANLPYRITLRPYDMGAAPLPTLHSYAVGEHDGLWVLLAGRTNGLHGFEHSGPLNFPESYQNRDVWVVDPAARETWHRALDSVESGLTDEQVAALTPTNNQFVQLGSQLYMTGGYGATAQGGLDTHNVLSAVDLPEIIDWVVNDTGQAADSIRMLQDELFRVTGGAMYAIDDRVHLVFGQSFRGGYVPNRNGQYTNQIRSFEIVDAGESLSVDHISMTDPQEAFRRRDLNVFPSLRRNQAQDLEQGLIVLSGVFTESFGAWTVPVEIDSQGIPAMADPNSPSAFKQGMNNYHSAKLGLFSERTDSMHEILFGGITLMEYDAVAQEFVQDDALPWTNQITAVIRDSDGQYQQHLIGEFPTVLDEDLNRLRFGANAQFLIAPEIATYDNGIIQLDELREPTVLGHVFGGLFANAPHVRGNPSGVSGASNLMFEVVYTPVPEPDVGILLASAAVVALFAARRRPVRRARAGAARTHQPPAETVALRKAATKRAARQGNPSRW